MPGNFLTGILDGGYTNYHVRVADVPDEYDIISIFRTTFQPPAPVLVWRTCFTCPAFRETEQQFKDGVAAQITKGKAVPLRVELNITDFTTPSTSSSFVTLADQYIDTYKFTGLDITAYPRTPAVVHLISAMRQIKATHSANFTLSFSFGSAFLQRASDAFDYQQTGVLIPILHALRSDITMLYPNDFDGGDSIVIYPNGSTITQGVSDYWVAMVLPLLRGFVAAGKDVPAFKPEQVSLGFATTGSSPFSSRVANFQRGVECLMLNTSCESLVAAGGPYPTLGGVAINRLNDDYFSGGATARRRRALREL
ncbi:hypothetical protein EXIGLDRAFT_697201 [Exidia glandulosa HHB12029]|uniref:Chitinase n=1 Tax=Exidia glandulosa HHB12029 TaxID=1314781 RepID=A0A165EW81_EXIGL|nr:hypothetical protein EXIGLDRAFT_697201 [Exidia glandulosa HHB12029]